MLWLGAFMPIIYTVGKSIDDIGGGVGVLDAVRGGGGLGLYILARLTVPVPVRRLRVGVPEVGLIAFLLVGLASTIWSVSPTTTLLKMVPLIATFLCLARLSEMYETRLDAIKGMVMTAHVITLGTIVQFIVIPSQTYSVNPEDPDSIARLHSTIPNIASNLMGLVIGIALAGLVLKIGPRWLMKQPANLISIVIYSVMLLGTRSRVVSIVALFIIIAAVLKWMNRSYARAGIAFASGAALLFTAVLLMGNERFVEAFSDFALRGQDARGVATLTGRTVIWEKAIPIWQEQPWLGYGYYAGHRLGLPAIDPLFAGYSNLDSTWIESLVNVGILGMAGLALFAVAGLFRAIRHARSLGRHGVIVAALCAGVIGLSFINPTIQSNTSTLVFFTAAVFALRPVSLDKDKPTGLQRVKLGRGQQKVHGHAGQVRRRPHLSEHQTQ